MKMNKVIFGLSILILVSSCATQQKTVELANGKMVTQKQYDKMLDKAFKQAEIEAKKAVKGKLTNKEIKEFNQSLTIEVDTTR